MNSGPSILERLHIWLLKFAKGAVGELHRRGVSEEDIRRILTRWKAGT